MTLTLLVELDQRHEGSRARGHESTSSDHNGSMGVRLNAMQCKVDHCQVCLARKKNTQQQTFCQSASLMSGWPCFNAPTTRRPEFASEEWSTYYCYPGRNKYGTGAGAGLSTRLSSISERDPLFSSWTRIVPLYIRACS